MKYSVFRVLQNHHIGLFLLCRSPRSSSPAVPVTIPAHQEELDGSGEQPHLYTNVNVGVPRLSSKSPSASPPM